MAEEKVIVTGGLEDYVADPRNFDYGSITELSAADISQLPERFLLPIVTYHHQKTSDFCTGFSTCEVTENQEEVTLHPEFQFAAGKRKRGNDPKAWGNSLNAALSAAVEFGSIPLSLAPDMTLDNKTRNFLADWKNWDNSVWEAAKKYKKKSFFEIKRYPALDLFDSIRLALWENREAKRSVVTGAQWRSSWNRPKDGIIPESSYGDAVGHAFKITGFDVIDGKPYLVIFPNYGKDLGKDGLLYMSRTVANRELFGAFMFVDIEVDVAKLIAKYSNGRALKASGPDIYIVKGGKKYRIPDENFMNAIGFTLDESPSGFMIIPDEDLDGIPTGNDLTLDDLLPPMREMFVRLKLTK